MACKNKLLIYAYLKLILDSFKLLETILYYYYVL